MSEKPPASAQIINLGIGSADVPAPEGGELDVGYWSTAEFRAVATEGGRKGLKLERAFWHALSTIGERLGVKRSTLISDVLRDASEQGVTNTASALRSYATGRLVADLEQARALTSTTFLIKVMQEAPLASVAVDRDRRLVRANREFKSFVLGLAGVSETAQLSAPDEAAIWRDTRVIIHTPVLTLFDEIGGSGETRDCLMSVRVGVTVRQRKLRIVGVPANRPEALVGFVTA
jgi:predicted DNA-binding ribbon-helix-helix protein